MLFALSGKFSCGKTTIANYFEGFDIIPIGKSIKDICNAIVEEDEAKIKENLKLLTEDKHKVQMMLEKYETYYQNLSDKTFEKGPDGHYKKTDHYRKLTQDVALGTRDVFGEDVWVKLAVEKMMKSQREGKNVICDDVRMPSEKTCLEKAGFTIIRFDVSKEEQRKRAFNLYGPIDESKFEHITETALDEASFDFRFDNTKLTEEETYEKVKHFVATNIK